MEIQAEKDVEDMELSETVVSLNSTKDVDKSDARKDISSFMA